MSLGRSSDGRLFTRDGRLCVGCCGGPLAEGCAFPFPECIPLSRNDGCPADFGIAQEGWAISITIDSLEAESSETIYFYNFNDLENQTFQVSNRSVSVPSTTWSGTLGFTGPGGFGTAPGNTAVICTWDTPITPVTASTYVETTSAVLTDLSGTTNFGGRWNSLQGITTFFQPASSPNGVVYYATGSLPAADLCRLAAERMAFNTVQTTAWTPRTPLDHDRQRLPPTPPGAVGSQTIQQWSGEDIKSAYRLLQKNNTCSLSGSRVQTGLELVNPNPAADWQYEPIIEETGTLFRPAIFQDGFGIDQQVNASNADDTGLIGLPDNTYSHTSSISVSPSANGYVLTISSELTVSQERKVNTRDGNNDFVAVWAPGWEATNTFTASYRVRAVPIGPCSGGVSGFFA